MDGTTAETELTAREREVLALASQGLTNNEIAARLGMKRNAVRYHLKEIHSKLGTGSNRDRLRTFGVRGWLGGLSLTKAGGLASMAGVVSLSAAGAFGVIYAHGAVDGAGGDSPQYCYGEAMMTPAPGYNGPPPPPPSPSVCFDTREEAAAYEEEIGLVRETGGASAATPTAPPGRRNPAYFAPELQGYGAAAGPEFDPRGAADRLIVEASVNAPFVLSLVCDTGNLLLLDAEGPVDARNGGLVFDYPARSTACRWDVSASGEWRIYAK